MLRRLSIAVVLALAGTSAGAQADLPGSGQTGGGAFAPGAAQRRQR